MSELDILRRRRELVVLSCGLQRATITHRLGRIETNPVRLAVGAAASAVRRPLVWRFGVTAIGFALRAFRNRSSARRSRRHSSHQH